MALGREGSEREMDDKVLFYFLCGYSFLGDVKLYGRECQLGMPMAGSREQDGQGFGFSRRNDVLVGLEQG